MTDQEYAAWLARGARRRSLIEIDASPMIRLSDGGYTTSPTDTPANIPYHAAIAGNISLRESLSLTGNARLSVSSIELHNESGQWDHLLDAVIDGREIRHYYGGPDWPRADFRLQMRGVVRSVEPTRRDRITIFLADKLSDLEVPVTEATIGGSGVNKDAHRPAVFGEVHNMTAVLEDAGTHRYRVGLALIERIIEARANGAPISITPNLSNGTFTTNANPYGTITASVQGDKTGGVYRNTVGALIQLLATGYGPFTSADIDTVNFTNFNNTHPQPVGLALMDSATVLQCCQRLADSLGAQIAMSRLGKLRIQKIDFPVSPTIDIHPKNYEYGTLRPLREEERVGAVKLGYCRNWTVQESLAALLPAESAANFQKEWLIALAKASAVLFDYPHLDPDPPIKETLLLRASDAQAEADRQLSIWSQRRVVYQINGFEPLLPVEVGNHVRLYGDRELIDGKAGIVINADVNWTTGRNVLEVLT